jgi:hypothetical protein
MDKDLRPFHSLTLPPGCVTGIGSLPAKDPLKAVEFVASVCPELPFWPQLPQRHWREVIIAQSLGPLLGLVTHRQSGYGYTVSPSHFDQFIARLWEDPVELDPTCAAGFFAFEEALAAGTFPRARAIKGQVEGPITLAFYLFREEECFANDPVLLAALARYSSRLAQWQIARLQKARLPLLLFIDEPALSLVGRFEGKTAYESFVSTLARLVQKVKESGAIVGVHCCSERPFQLMLDANPDIFSFDAYQNLEAFFACEPGRAILQKDCLIAFGLIPTFSSFDDFSTDSLLERWAKATGHQVVSNLLLPKSLFTATCGLGLLEEKAASDSFRIAHEFSRTLRSRVQNVSSDQLLSR